MKKGKHIQIDFIKFLIEKYITTSKEIKNEDEPQDEEEVSDEEEISDEEKSQDDETIEKLITEYKKIKKQYENRRIQN